MSKKFEIGMNMEEEHQIELKERYRQEEKYKESEDQTS